MAVGFLWCLLASEVLHAGTQTVLHLPAWEAHSWGSGVVILEPDFLHVSTFDAVAGKQRWRTRFQETANGFHSIHLVGDRLFVYAGNRLVVLGMGKGQTLESHAVPFRRDRLNTGGCGFTAVNGACALECDCRLQFRSCLDGSPIGPEYRSTEICFSPMDDTDPGGCDCYPGAWAFGRAGDLLLAGIEDQDRKSQSQGLMKRPRTFVGVDGRTGREVYRAETLGVASWSREKSGISPDGRTCWLCGGKDDGLNVFECQTGKLLAHHKDCTTHEPLPAERPRKEGDSDALRGEGETQIPGVIARGETLLVAATPNEVRIFELETHQERARFEGEFLILKVEGSLGPGKVAMFRYAKKGPGEVWILRTAAGAAP